MSEIAHDPLLSRTIAGKYAIASFVGAGAMGAVYRARHIALDTLVAVKVLKEPSPGGSFAERFRREARAASRLDHPNSVRILDYGEEPDGLLYLVMELLDGRELASVIEREPLSTLRIVSIVGQALAAVAIAHDHGVIHRDLKPENIMILRRADDDGAEGDLVKVCDFGIAKLQHAEPSAGRRLTTQGEVIGTPEFMSPEQARGEELDARSDLYSMGVILFEMLTGRPPFESDTALGLALMHVTDVPPLPSSLAPGVDRTLERICLKAMSKRREDRYQSAREMRGDLRSALEPSMQTGSLPGSLRTSGRTTATSAFVRPADTMAERPVGARRTETIATDAVVATNPAGDRRRRGLFIVAGFALASALAVTTWKLAHSPHETDSPVPTPTAIASATGPTLANTTVATPNANPAPLGSAALPTEPPTTEPPPTAPPLHAKSVGHKSGPAASVGVSPEPRIAVTVSTAPTSGASGPSSIATSTVSGPGATSPSAAAIATTATAIAAPTPSAAATATTPFDPSTARAIVASATATNGVSGSSVRASLNGAAMTSCYRDALEAKGAPASGNATLQMSIDDAGRVTSATLVGAEFLPAMKACIEAVTRLARIKGVDTGDAAATVSLTFIAK